TLALSLHDALPISAPVVRAILETKCWGIKLQICRRMLNWERAGAILSLFMPAVWQEHAKSSSPFPQILWDDCESVSQVEAVRRSARVPDELRALHAKLIS